MLFTLCLLAKVCLLAGMLLASTTTISIALVLWVLLALIYVANVFKILFHLTNTRHANDA